jgi:hypothetical protein
MFFFANSCKVLQEWAANMRKNVRLIGEVSKEIGSLAEF